MRITYNDIIVVEFQWNGLWLNQVEGFINLFIWKKKGLEGELSQV